MITGSIAGSPRLFRPFPEAGNLAATVNSALGVSPLGNGVRGELVNEGSDLLITIRSAQASDSWGFVGIVLVGEHEAYRTIRAHNSPREAIEETQQLLAGVLGALMAGQEWRSAQDQFGHAPRRVELEFGLRGRARLDPAIEGEAADA